jgi:hypothetical protein
MAEWLKAHAWKACLGETLTWVRIPLSPPPSPDCREISHTLPEIPAKSPPIRSFLISNRTAEKPTPNAMEHPCRNFLCGAKRQSAFPVSMRRMECDEKPINRRRRLDLLIAAGNRFSLRTEPIAPQIGQLKCQTVSAGGSSAIQTFSWLCSARLP